MARESDPLAGFQPSIQTVELVCERLGELGCPVGSDTARELLRAIFASEAPRLDARVRDALNTSLETIRVAAQSALGVLGSTAPVTPAPRPLLPSDNALPSRARKTPSPGASRVARSSGGKQKQDEAAQDSSSRRGQANRGRDDLEGGERRPVFRRPRGR
jgi:hypothetical protein